MKIFKGNFWDQVFIRVTSGLLVSLITALLSVALIIAIAIYDPLKKIVEENVPISILIILIIILLVLLSLSFLYILNLKRKLNLNLHRALGAYWDNELNPYCPACKTMLTNYQVYETIKNYEFGMKCISCDNVVHFCDEVKRYYELDSAKQIVKKIINSRK